MLRKEKKEVQEFDEERELIKLKVQLKQKVDVGNKMEEQFKERYRTVIEQKMDLMLQAGTQKLCDRIYNPPTQEQLQ